MTDETQKAMARAAELTKAAEEFRRRGRDLVTEHHRETLPKDIVERIEALEKLYMETQVHIQQILQAVAHHAGTIDYIMLNGQAFTGVQAIKKAG